MSKRLLTVAGEASGDLHGSNLIKSILDIDNSIKFYGIGGVRMASCGFNAIFDSKELAVVGISELLSKLSTIKKAFDKLKNILDSDRPDAVVLIDYPDFNIRFAKEAKKRGIPVVYYISPQVWAWRKGRVRKIAGLVDKMLVIFPFEVQLYKDAGVDVEYVGHPLLDEVKCGIPKEGAKSMLGIEGDKQIIAIAPGSRMNELKYLMPEMLDAAVIIKKALPDVEFILPLANTLERKSVEYFFNGRDIHIRIFENKMHEVMSASDIAIVASGTATLETALLETPMVVVYKVSPLTYLMGRMLVDVTHISLANIVAGEKIVPELLQYDANPENIADNVLKILNDKEVYNNIKKRLKIVRENLGNSGASKRAAEAIYKLITQILKRKTQN